MPTLNYTTTVAAVRTIAEIQTMLVQHGADAIVTRYTDQQPVGLSFRLPTAHGIREFSLPVDPVAVKQLLDNQPIASRFQGSDRAVMVAWRIMRSWLEAQLAIIETGMVAFDQVMLPYMHAGGELTVYDAYVAREASLLALTVGSDA